MLVNLTPHQIIILDADHHPIKVIEPEETPARVAVKKAPLQPLEGVPFWVVKYNQPTDLPESQHGVTYIVSMLVAQAAPDRRDLVTPFDMVRDDAGGIIGCQGLVTQGADYY